MTGENETAIDPDGKAEIHFSCARCGVPLVFRVSGFMAGWNPPIICDGCTPVRQGILKFRWHDPCMVTNE